VSAQQVWERTRLARRQEHIAHVRTWLHQKQQPSAPKAKPVVRPAATLADILGVSSAELDVNLGYL
jgi:hypothetical protein